MVTTSVESMLDFFGLLIVFLLRCVSFLLHECQFLFPFMDLLSALLSVSLTLSKIKLYLGTVGLKGGDLFVTLCLLSVQFRMCGLLCASLLAVLLKTFNLLVPVDDAMFEPGVLGFDFFDLLLRLSTLRLGTLGSLELLLILLQLLIFDFNSLL